MSTHNRAVPPVQITAALSAAGLLSGYAVAVATGSRPLGGVVLAAFAAACVVLWRRRDGMRVTLWLSLCGVLAFAGSHALGEVIGAWPAVLAVSAALGTVCWRVSDRPALARATRTRASSAAR